MAWDERDEEERRLLRARLRVLAERSGLPLPQLDVVDDPKGRLLPATVRNGGDGEDHIAVSSSLLRASPAEQVWHLASALGHWASPVPRRRRWEGWVVTAVLVACGIGYGLVELDGTVDLPQAAAVAASAVVGLLVSIGAAALARRGQAAYDEAGREVLRRSGYDPQALTRQVFGDRPDPPWWTRVHAREPAPSRRVAAAGRPGGPEVAPPLH